MTMESRPDGRRILLSAISFYDIASDLNSDFSKGFEEELEDSADGFRIGERKSRSIVSYEVVDGELGRAKTRKVENKLKKYQNDIAAQQEIWDLFSRITPPELLDLDNPA